MRSVSSEWLIDTVVHSPLVRSSRGKSYGPDATIENVCVQNKNVKTIVDGNQITTAGALMIWDVSKSTSATFNVGDKITYTDKMSGESIDRYIVDGMPGQTTELHHIELTLV